MNRTVEYFSKQASVYPHQYHGNEEFKERLDRWFGLIEKYARNRKSAIDVGCGSGVLSFYLARKGLRVLGLDSTAEMIETCQRTQSVSGLTNVKFEQVEIPHINGLEIAPADLILASSVLEYIVELEETLEFFHRISTDNGVMIISLPNKNSVYRKAEKLIFKMTGQPEYREHVKHEMTLSEATTLCERIGFALLEAHYFARVTLLSKFLALFLPAKYVDSLFVAVFQKLSG